MAMNFFSETNITTIYNSVNQSSGCNWVECYKWDMVREIVNSYVYYVNNQILPIYEPNVNSSLIVDTIQNETRYLSGQIAKVLWDMHNLAKNKKITIPIKEGLNYTDWKKIQEEKNKDNSEQENDPILQPKRKEEDSTGTFLGLNPMMWGIVLGAGFLIGYYMYNK